MTTQQQREFNSRLAILAGRGAQTSDESGPRRSGKTYRSVLRCLLWASENPGKNVLYACYRREAAREAFHMACGMVGNIGRKVEPQNMRIILPNSSVLVFACPGDDKALMGQSFAGIARDVNDG